MVIGPEIVRECGCGNIKFGDSISGFFQKKYRNNFSSFLKDNGAKTNYQKPMFYYRCKIGKPMMFGLLKYSKSFIAEEINNLTQTK
jgi:hypothetical protein